MAETLLPQRWVMRLLYLAVVAFLVFLHLLPLGHLPPKFAGPDLVMALTFSWAVRRPEFVPILLVALVALALDLLLQRPPGLWAALMVMGTEALRQRSSAMCNLSFIAEWGTVAGIMLAVTLAYRAVLTVLMVQQAALGLSLMQLVSTLLVYPAVVLVSHVVFRVRKRMAHDLEAGGQRA